MKYTKLGRSGLEISRLCLGCMSLGEPARGSHPWTLGDAESRVLLKHALDLGINFFDTANVYSDGTSEEIVGRALVEYAPRDEIVIATKVNARMRPGVNAVGLSRKAILAEVDHSLRRLGVEYIDLYQVHRFDYHTPIEETLETLHDLVRTGKVRYVGASSMYAWQFAKMMHVAERRGLSRFVSMQNYVNLLYREEEREMLPLCADEGVGVLVWSPLARGRLTRPWGERTARSENDRYGDKLFEHTREADRGVVEALAGVARARNLPSAQVALAWLLQKSPVAAPIIGATKAAHLDDAVAALDVTLAADEIAALEAPYEPHAIVGFE